MGSKPAKGGDSSEKTVHDRALRDRPGAKSVKIPGYNLFDVVGHGGAGIVYRAQRSSDGCVTAVKVLRREFCFDSLMLNRFEREIQAISMLEHPNIVKVYDVGQSEDGRPFYSMEFLRGETLKERIQASPKLSVHQAISIFSEVGYAICYAHDQGIVHRDLKSSNIILLEHLHEELRVKLVDFGVAKFLEPRQGQRGLTRQGAMLGSTTAMSPEQIRGRPIDRRADIYALGVLLFEILTGELPFIASEPQDLLRMHLEQPAPLPSQRHRPVYAFDAIVQRALQKRREDRFESAREMVDACQLALQRPGLRPSAPTQRVSALGLCVRLDVKPEAMTEAPQVRAIASLNQKVHESFQSHGLVQPISTMHAQLGLVLLPDDPAQTLATLSQCEQLMVDLGTQLSEAQGSGVQARVTLHVDDAEVSSQDERFIAGPILQYEDWSMTSCESKNLTRITPMVQRVREQAQGNPAMAQAAGDA